MKKNSYSLRNLGQDNFDAINEENVDNEYEPMKEINLKDLLDAKKYTSNEYV